MFYIISEGALDDPRSEYVLWLWQGDKMTLQSRSGAEITHIPLKRQEQYEQWRMALAQRFPNRGQYSSRTK
jgi:hypothetical protein